MTDAIGNMRTFPAIQRLFTPYFIIPGFLVFFGVSFFPLHKLIANGAFVLVSVFPLAAGLLLGLRLGLLYWFLHSVMLFIFAPLVGQTIDDLLSSGLATYFITLILTWGVGKIRDLTIALRHELNERERYENELRQYKDELEKLVEKRTRELVESNDRLKQEIVKREKANKEKMNLEISLKRAEKMEAVGILAGSVAHDLNNILGGIIGYPELLLLQIPNESPLRRSILAIKQSGERAAAVVQDLLTLSRRGVVALQVVNINHIISDFLKSLEFRNLIAERPGITIETDLHQELFGMSGSPVHLSKMIMNLVANSIESMPHGGQLNIATKNVYLYQSEGLFEVPEEGEYVSVQISDSGEGIAGSDLEKIFEPFYTNKIMGKSGTGLGLAIVWGTVKDHKGYVDVQSEVGVGTNFTLFFPATRENVTIQEPHLELEEYSGTGQTILVVDDVELQRDICSSILGKLGYIVASVSSGKEAIEYLHKTPVDLLVLDMIMPGCIDGLETYEQIVAIRPGQKAVVVSGFTQTERVKKVMALGAGAYVKKPYTIEKLGVAVNEVLRNK
jgi:two-component system, cell cycle sensor histidine kinase and response regulator CckA